MHAWPGLSADGAARPRAPWGRWSAAPGPPAPAAWRAAWPASPRSRTPAPAHAASPPAPLLAARHRRLPRLVPLQQCEDRGSPSERVAARQAAQVWDQRRVATLRHAPTSVARWGREQLHNKAPPRRAWAARAAHQTVQQARQRHEQVLLAESLIVAEEDQQVLVARQRQLNLLDHVGLCLRARHSTAQASAARGRAGCAARQQACNASPALRARAREQTREAGAAWRAGGARGNARVAAHACSCGNTRQATPCHTPIHSARGSWLRERTWARVGKNSKHDLAKVESSTAVQRPRTRFSHGFMIISRHALRRVRELRGWYGSVALGSCTNVRTLPLKAHGHRCGMTRLHAPN